MRTISSKVNSGVKPKEKISYEDFLAWRDEDTWAEWVDGEIVMAPAASAKHQDIGSFLENFLRRYIESKNLGRLFRAPFQMKLGPNLSGREPDLLYLASENLDRLRNTYVDGPADMVIEIVSKESVNRDRQEKFGEYEAAGVSEYWIIDPIREEAEFYRLGADGYHPVFPDEEGIYHSEAVKGFWLRVSWLWQEPLPSVWYIWRELDLL